ncbi:Pyruvate dehydrogenase E1 subunit beta [Candidatus Cyrtobacter comes]|uniref:Pyruvate dehydrogenase E1 subunit beta n=1 Tax=Candidatus Cyrtobacter comes TaxID=675776 RepID=A0ABU5L8J6_9RICK|nr:pyruvate dehydrogenase complex E1 component subunit beta [Candidatus Cyrtobacter comes]MDZ5762439.1 Pyruvate dehydrogenase E1 subunit beta [Candidatus Cyrtobacter comes]
MYLVREAIRDGIAEEMRLDENVLIMGEEVAQYQGAYKVTQGLLEEFGDKRVIDTPISEHGFAGLAVGAALSGLKVIVEFMTFNFALQAMDQIVNSAAKTCYMSGGQLNCPIVFRGPNGAASRVAAQHSQCFASWFSHIPGLKVVSPYYAHDHKAMIKQSIQDPNPVIFLENEILYGRSHEDPNYNNHEKAMVIRSGTDVTLVSFSLQVENALLAAELLQKDGISVEVIDLRIIRPLDIDTIINSVQKTNRIIVLEEGWSFCGLASEICVQVSEKAFDYLDAPPQRITGKDIPLPYAANLEKACLPQVTDIVSVAKSIL